MNDPVRIGQRTAPAQNGRRTALLAEPSAAPDTTVPPAAPTDDAERTMRNFAEVDTRAFADKARKGVHRRDRRF